jgi:pimeloyl-ACP methyl ester carboxylesterase
VHGLASNARTWDGVAQRLNEAGHTVVAVDQRGHGLSDKPDTGYSFDEVTADIRALIEALGWEKPLVAGQSWGGNVVLDFAARWPDSVAGLVLVDGGFIELSSSPDASWEKVAVDLKPPALAGMARTELAARISEFHPRWTGDMVEMTLDNFETLPDGTVKPWLSLEHHMDILRALWEHKPSQIYGRVTAPVLIAVAESQRPGGNPRKHDEAAAAERGLGRVSLRWFKDAAHDIHVDKPDELAGWMLAAEAEGFFD